MTEKVSKRDLQMILGEELKKDVKIYGKVLSAKGLWRSDHWESIIVKFEKCEKTYHFDF